MALTESSMLALGTAAPDFSLQNVLDGQTLSRAQAAGPKGLLVFFICAHCPYVKHINDGLAALGRDYAGKGIGFAAISSNSVATHPDDGPDGMKAQATQFGFNFPYLYDEPQTTAHAYKAACTPDFFLFNADLKLVYRGQFDASRPGNNKPVTGEDLRAALDLVLAGKPVPENQLPSIGCNIKWK